MRDYRVDRSPVPTESATSRRWLPREIQVERHQERLRRLYPHAVVKVVGPEGPGRLRRLADERDDVALVAVAVLGLHRARVEMGCSDEAVAERLDDGDF